MTDEAKWILENRNIPDRGVFCEIGAFSGLEGSNTLPFEQMGWSGLICEPDPLNAWKCRENRKCDVLCAAIGFEGLNNFQIDLDDRGLSGLDRAPKNRSTIVVPVISLRRVFEFMEQPVDLLSIDTEGTEVEVLRTIGPYRPKIIIIEYNTLGKPLNDATVANEMISFGYKMVWKNDINMVFTLDQE